MYLARHAVRAKENHYILRLKAVGSAALFGAVLFATFA